ncbi:MAG: thermonuclease family protein [Burkholderiales bacterium]
MKRAGWLIALGVLCASAAAAPLPQSVRAQVIYVTDGDTVKVRDAAGEEHWVRIISIDAPEKGRRDKPGQRYSDRSRKYLAALVAGEQVLLLTRGHDDYGRMLARIWFDGTDAGLAQVCAGYAWVYEAFVMQLPAADQQAYRDCQIKAKADRRGLWRDAHPVPPWVWRHTQGHSDRR